MSANAGKVVVARATMWAAELQHVLRQPRNAQQQATLARLLDEAQVGFADLLTAIQIYADSMQDAAIALNRDGLPIPAACRDAQALASVAQTLLGELRP